MLRAIERFCGVVEVVAGLLLGAVMLLIVASTAGRYLFTWAIPDSFDISRLMIGACIMWGLASIGYRGGHICVDLLYEVVGKRWRQFIDFFAWLSLLVFTAALSYQLYFRVVSAFRSNESTFDLRLQVWPFLLLIWIGCAVSLVTVALSILRPASMDGQSETEGHGL